MLTLVLRLNFEKKKKGHDIFFACFTARDVAPNVDSAVVQHKMVLLLQLVSSSNSCQLISVSILTIIQLFFCYLSNCPHCQVKKIVI